MTRQPSIDTIWRGAKDIFLPYEGATTALHMLEIPIEHRLDITNTYLDAVSISRISRMGWHEEENWESFNSDTQAVFAKGETQFNWIFYGGLDKGRFLNMWFDYYNDDKFEIELVFWADLFFPNPDDENNCLQSFKDLINLAHSLRAISPSSELAFNGWEAADPREHRDEPSTFFW